MVALVVSGDNGGVNPQDATIPEDSGEDDHSDSSDKKKKPVAASSSRKQKKKKTQQQQDGHNNGVAASNYQPNQNNNSKKKKSASSLIVTIKKRKKRNRVVRLAKVDDESCCATTSSCGKEGSLSTTTTATTSSRPLQPTPPPSIPLPVTQYQTTLWRRAIRKRPDENSPPSPPRGDERRDGKTNSPQHKRVIDIIINNKNSDDGDDDNNQVEIYGDISLGMKLSVVGGKVIVQKLNALSDGRASPAQMVGVIQRGDLLLSIDNMSLVHLPIDLLMERLKPLSTPDSAGNYQRILHLRLAAGEGLDLLRKYEAAETRKANVLSVDETAANELFSLFPMVDQLSGMPLFDHNNPMFSPSVPPAPQQQQRQQQHHHRHQEEKKQTEDDSPPLSGKGGSDESRQRQNHPMQHTQNLQASQDIKSLDQIISGDVASRRTVDRDKFISQFYSWNEKCSGLMRPAVRSRSSVVDDNKETTDDNSLMTKSQMLDLGRKALLGAANISRTMESLDRGKDMRSFRSWNSSISLRSRASTRRRYVLDAVSLPVIKLDTKSAATGGGRSGMSLASDGSEKSDMEDVDGDALLLRLAAHDEIWRRQVIEALEKASFNLENDSEESSEDEAEASAANGGGIDDAITKELGAFLFGETMNKIVTKKKKSKALPPPEITAVLFDLSTNLASTMPDEVAVGTGSTTTGLLKSSLVPFMGRKRPEAGSSVILATRFVLCDALVVWLETFRPLPWESRRVLWPSVKVSPTSEESRSLNMFSDADSLTVDSGNMSPTSAYTSSNITKRDHSSKDLRQQIEDQELDVETRAETCFLVTYYFTQRLLPKVVSNRSATGANDWSEGSPVEKGGDLVGFVKTYGAYMKLHTCLAYAALLKCSDVIDELLKLAEHDARHCEVIKLFARRNALILYEPTMLSAIVKCLPLIRKETSADRRQVLVDICVSAYPDLCPWQVKQALLEFEANGTSVITPKTVGKDLKELYYYYLSNLLHPRDGHSAARHDAALVEEWCILSLDASNSARRKNFYIVASRSSSDHLAYHRDLVMLIKLCMASNEHDLALELAGEIVDNSKLLARKDSVLLLVVQYLREIAHDALNCREHDKQNTVLRSVKRVIRLFHQMSTLSMESGKQCIYVSDELQALLEYKESCTGGFSGKVPNREVLDLIHFLSNEAAPQDFLKAFSAWTESHEMLSDTVHVLQSVLRRGARLALNTELSGSLLRLRRARQRMNGNVCAIGPALTTNDADSKVPEETIWSLMSQGLVGIDK